MSQSVEIVVLSEDRQQECFVRRFLHLFVPDSYRRCRFRTAPRGRSSGEQWVRESFPRELQEHRSQRARLGCCLLTVIDADLHTIDQRIDDYRQTCCNHNVEFVNLDDRVAFIVPARNIESWLAYLQGETVDEASVYRKLDYESDCQPQVEALYSMCRAGQLREPAPASLVRACREFTRLGL